MGLWTCVLLLAALHIRSFGAYNIIEVNNGIKELTEIGRSDLKKIFDLAVTESLKVEDKFESANVTCQPFLKPLKDQCSKCVEDLCWQRALQINCRQDDYFNISFDTGIFRINEKIDHFYANVLPHFFNEDLKQFFGQDVAYFFNNNIYDIILKSLPKSKSHELFARLIKRDETYTTNGDNVAVEQAGIADKTLKKLTNYIQEFIKTSFKKYGSEDLKKIASNFFINSVPNALQKASQGIKGFFQGVFESRRRRRSLFPLSCDKFLGDDQVQLTCLPYLQNCSECLPNKMALNDACPGLSKIEDEIEENIWIIPAAISIGPVFQIENMSHVPVDGGSEKIMVTVIIFGRTTKIEINSSPNENDPEKMGNVIANKALDWFKQHWEKKEDEIPYVWDQIEKLGIW